MAIFLQDHNRDLVRACVKKYKTKELVKLAKVCFITAECIYCDYDNKKDVLQVFENLKIDYVMAHLGLEVIDDVESQLLDMVP